jgi:hypothetical protein
MGGNAAMRARRLAKPSWGLEGRSNADFEQLLNEEFFLNQTTDWSFNHSWQGHGDWSNHHDYISGVPSNNKTIIFMKRENV